MSVDLDWKKLDSELAGHVKDFLNKHFQNITKPSFIGDIEVTAFEWGNETPQIEITNITDPFPEFYEVDHDEEGGQQVHQSTTQTPPSRPVSHTASSMAPSEDYFLDHTHPTLSRPSLTPLLQQPRFSMIHSFHRSPMVAPQHPFNIHQNSNYFSPMPTHTSSPPSATSWPSRPASVLDEDWIDDEEINRVPEDIPAHNPSIMDSKTTEMDFQVHMLVSYKGDTKMTIMTELRMNYPSVMFMSLPIQLCVRSIEFEATAVVGYIQSMNRVCVSMLEEDYQHIRGKESGLNSLLRDVHIESIVGDEQKQGSFTHLQALLPNCMD
ncbi:hypothetical protein BY458DRAFT_488874 [Sporodiniella umbellata]|nr:hypothetical protein BY458DRAFT_488874 [Sporodiniella umbellata]